MREREEERERKKGGAGLTKNYKMMLKKVSIMTFEFANDSKSRSLGAQYFYVICPSQEFLQPQSFDSRLQKYTLRSPVSYTDYHKAKRTRSITEIIV